MSFWAAVGWSGGVTLPEATSHEFEESANSRARVLKHLLQSNHVEYSVIYNKLRFVNHVPHVLGSAFIIGADAATLKHIYKVQRTQLDTWEDSPGEIQEDNWRQHFGKRNYQRAYLDFFEDQLATNYNHDWKALLKAFLLAGNEPLINALICGLAHPLIHLGYALELSSKTIAVETLALAACFHGELNQYLDDPKYTKPADHPTGIFALIDRIYHDRTFDKLPYVKDVENVQKVLEDEDMAAAALEHWNAWRVHRDPAAQFKESQKFAVAVLASSSTPIDDKKYDFFIVHILTSSHGVRAILPFLSAKFQVQLLRQWWLLSMMVYIAQQRPRVDLSAIENFDLKGRSWQYVLDNAVTGRYRANAHYVKAIRSIHMVSATWGDSDQFFLKSAVKVSDEFDNWGGFGPRDPDFDLDDAFGRSDRRYSGQGDDLMTDAVNG